MHRFLHSAKLPALGIERLLSFLAVVDHGGFGKAAESLHRSQSRVSMHVIDLERTLGARLIDRAVRPVAVTDVGVALYEHARRALAELDLGLGHVEAMLNLEEGQVRIGSYASASASFLPAVMGSFAEEHPKIHIALFESGAIDAEEALRNRTVTMAVRSAYPRPADDIVFRPLWREPMQVVLPQSHPALGEGAIDVETLVQAERVILVGASLTQQVGGAHALDTMHTLKTLGVDASRVVFTAHPQALVSMVRAGLGVGVANGLALTSSSTDGLAIRSIDRPDAFRDVVLC